MKAWIYRWLPILCGCHCRDDRSFHWKGRRFPLCARCTGELFGLIFGAATFAFFHPGAPLSALLLLPMIVDGAVQAATAYESTNPRRFVTGALFGYGILCLFLLSSIAVFRLGLAVGAQWKG